MLKSSIVLSLFRFGLFFFMISFGLVLGRDGGVKIFANSIKDIEELRQKMCQTDQVNLTSSDFLNNSGVLLQVVGSEDGSVQEGAIIFVKVGALMKEFNKCGADYVIKKKDMVFICSEKKSVDWLRTVKLIGAIYISGFLSDFLQQKFDAGIFALPLIFFHHLAILAASFSAASNLYEWTK